MKPWISLSCQLTASAGTGVDRELRGGSPSDDGGNVPGDGLSDDDGVCGLSTLSDYHRRR